MLMLGFPSQAGSSRCQHWQSRLMLMLWVQVPYLLVQTIMYSCIT